MIFLFFFYIWLGEHLEMTPKHDIGWKHVEPFGGNRRTPKCKYCGKIIHGGITRLSNTLHISPNKWKDVQVYLQKWHKALNCICLMLRMKKE